MAALFRTSRFRLMSQLTMVEYLDFKRWWNRARFGHERHNMHAALAVLPWANDGTSIEEFIWPMQGDGVDDYLSQLMERRKEQRKQHDGK